MNGPRRAEHVADIHGLTEDMLSGPPPAVKLFEWPFA